MSATEVLRRMLDERGVEWSTNETLTDCWTRWNAGKFRCTATEINGTFAFTVGNSTPEQAIAATVGSELPYDELLRWLENDWHISASWDGLRKFWCIELTEEGVKLRNSAHGTLTVDQVREAIKRNFSKAAVIDDGGNKVEWREGWVCNVGFNFRAIADELNAALGDGECKVESSVAIEFDTLISPDFFEFEMSCGSRFRWSDNEPPDYCPGCGRKVAHGEG